MFTTAPTEVAEEEEEVTTVTTDEEEEEQDESVYSYRQMLQLSTSQEFTNDELISYQLLMEGYANRLINGYNNNNVDGGGVNSEEGEEDAAVSASASTCKVTSQELMTLYGKNNTSQHLLTISFIMNFNAIINGQEKSSNINSDDDDEDILPILFQQYINTNLFKITNDIQQQQQQSSSAAAVVVERVMYLNRIDSTGNVMDNVNNVDDYYTAMIETLLTTSSPTNIPSKSPVVVTMSPSISPSTLPPTTDSPTTSMPTSKTPTSMKKVYNVDSSMILYGMTLDNNNHQDDQDRCRQVQRLPGLRGDLLLLPRDAEVQQQ